MSSASTSQALYAFVSSTSQAPAVPADAPDKAHHNQHGQGFRNPWPSWSEMAPTTIIWGMIKRRFTGRANNPDTTPPTVPTRRPHFLPTRDTPRLRATWLGHACYFVEFPGGLRVLFDPVFTARCSPLTFLGPKRYTDMPCQIEDIPLVDLVVISHNHYDHLSHPTVMKIKEKNPRAHFFVPLGNKKWFEESGIKQVTELDWWESKDVSLSSAVDKNSNVDVSDAGSQTDHLSISATIGCVPCQHMTARSPFDRAHTLWASWTVESKYVVPNDHRQPPSTDIISRKVYFAGDTGYRAVPESADGKDDYAGQYADLPHCPAFAQIGEHRGPFDLGLIPIGAYMPRWIMSPMHANPFDSVNIFRDTRCKRALGMHWGTWVLTEEDVLEPPTLLKEALKQKGLPEEGLFDVCDIGESREFGEDTEPPKSKE